MWLLILGLIGYGQSNGELIWADLSDGFHNLVVIGPYYRFAYMIRIIHNIWNILGHVLILKNYLKMQKTHKL
jgi:hypothetical protein